MNPGLDRAGDDYRDGAGAARPRDWRGARGGGGEGGGVVKQVVDVHGINIRCSRDNTLRARLMARD
jgi:hypothetical protein